MHIAIVGTGYVGLVTGACLADMGHHVMCIDRDGDKISRLQQGHVPIYEPGLDEIIQRHRALGTMSFTTDYALGLDKADVVFLAVGTPSLNDDDGVDLSYLFDAARSVAAHVQHQALVVIKSTVPMGTWAKVQDILLAENPHTPLEVASNPEFLREGHALGDFKQPFAIVMGTQTPWGADMLARVYETMPRDTWIYTTPPSAELIKYTINAFLAVKITFMNDLANLCEASNVDIDSVIQTIGRDPRIGPLFLQPGPGYGGSCFPKDTRALAFMGQERGVDMVMVRAAIARNHERQESMVDRIESWCGGDLRDKVILILGLSFKANTDDIRESPALPIIRGLIRRGATVRCHDPVALSNAKVAMSYYPITWCDDLDDGFRGADGAVIVTEWDVYRQMDLHHVGGVMRTKQLMDLRRVIDPDKAIGAGFNLYRLGSPMRDAHELMDLLSATQKKIFVSTQPTSL